MAKIKVVSRETAEETFARFLPVKRAEGIATKTAESYSQHFRAISKHLDVNRAATIRHTQIRDPQFNKQFDASTLEKPHFVCYDSFIQYL